MTLQLRSLLLGTAVAALAVLQPASAQSAFVANHGQWDHRARFVCHTDSMSVFLDERGWAVSLTGPTRGAAFRMTFEDSSEQVRVVGEHALRAHHNYFYGPDPSRWCTGVPLYQSVRYDGLYHGVDVRMRQSEGHPEYDLLLAPGADLAQVSLRVSGANGLRITPDGSLVIETDLGPVTQPLPLTWQVGTSGERQTLACRYVLLESDRFGFEVDGWDTSLHLTIDPGLVYLRFLGTPGIDIGRTVHVDEQGITTVAGYTDNRTYPTTLGSFDRVFNGGNDTFVSRLDPSLVTGPFAWGGQLSLADLVWSTFLGGGASDIANHLSVDDQGVVTLTGETASPGFPVTQNAFDTSFNGGKDAYVLVLDPTRPGAAQLVYSTFVGGSAVDVGWELSVDAAGVIAVAGDVLSADFPTTAGAFQSTSSGRDAFVLQLDPDLVGAAQLVYSTYLGGNNRQIGGYAYAVSIAPGGLLTVVGFTDASDFPTTAGAFDTTHDGGLEAFVSQLDPGRTGAAQLVYSTFLGGLRDEIAMDVETEARGLITVVGWTNSLGFPTTAGAFDQLHAGGTDVFVSQLDPARSGSAQLGYSTYLGGAGNEAAVSVAVDTAGVMTLTGRTASPGFPTTLGAQHETYLGGTHDAFVARLDSQRSASGQLLYSTFLGSEDTDQGNALFASPTGLVAVAGQTVLHDPSDLGPWETFVAHLDMLPTGVTALGTSSPGCSGTLSMAVTSMPRVGNAAFSITCTNAPPVGAGFLVLSTATVQMPLAFLGGNIWLNLSPPVIAVRAVSNGLGAAEVVIPIPATPQIAGAGFAGQFLWAGPSAPPPCPALGSSLSNALEMTVQI